MAMMRKNIFFFSIFFILLLIITPSLMASVVLGELKGNVQIIPAHETEGRAAVQGDSLNPNDKVQTGKNGSAKILIENTGEIQLSKETTWSYDQFVSTNEKRDFSAYLAIGRLKADVQKLPAGSSFQIKTPTSVAAVRGTSFGLFVYAFEGQVFTQLEVFENAVQFSNSSNDQSYVVEQGNSAIANESGAITPPQSSGAETEKALEDDSKKVPSGNGPGGGGNDGSRLNEQSVNDSRMNPMTKNDSVANDFPTPDTMGAGVPETPDKMSSMESMQVFNVTDPTSNAMPGVPENLSPTSGGGGAGGESKGSTETLTGISPENQAANNTRQTTTLQ